MMCKVCQESYIHKKEDIYYVRKSVVIVAKIYRINIKMINNIDKV